MSSRQKPGAIGLIIVGIILILIIGALIVAPFMIYFAFQGGSLDKATGAGGGGICGNIPQPYLDYFTQAGNKFSVQPSFVAAIFVGEHRSVKDSNYKTWPAPNGPWASSDKGANGPFQFLQSTWQGYQQDGNGDGVMDIQNLADASFGASNYLAHLGAGSYSTNEASLRDAASRYNSGRKWDEGQNITETNNYVTNLVMPSFKAFLCSNAEARQGNDGVPLYKQSDPRYGHLPYGSSTIAASGCCTSSAAMVMRFASVDVDPVSISQFSAEHGFYIPGEGTDHAGLFPLLAKTYDLQFQDLTGKWDQAVQNLKSHKPLIVRGAGAEPFTSGGHCIVLTGIDDNNLVRVNNPARGDGPYPLSQLQKQVTKIYYLGK